jgi:hypothetical protein
MTRARREGRRIKERLMDALWAVDAYDDCDGAHSYRLNPPVEEYGRRFGE